MKVDVVCLGILVADVIARPVDAVPGRGSLRLLDAIELHGGGCALNTASALVRLGASAAVVGNVGRDPFGRYLLELLRARAVDAAGVFLDDRVPTSASVVLVARDGERTFLHVPGANATLTRRQLSAELLRRGRWLHVAGAGLLRAVDGEPLARVLENARRDGIRTSLDTAGGADLEPVSVEPLLPHVDLACPSLCEAEAVSRRSDPVAVARWFRDRGARAVVVKLGADGAYALADEYEGFVAPPRVHVVDTTGAGDAFAAGLLRGRLAGLGLEDSVRLACAAGALATTAIGAFDGVADLRRTRALAASSPRGSRPESLVSPANG